MLCKCIVKLMHLVSGNFKWFYFDAAVWLFLGEMLPDPSGLDPDSCLAMYCRRSISVTIPTITSRSCMFFSLVSETVLVVTTLSYSICTEMKSVRSMYYMYCLKLLDFTGIQQGHMWIWHLTNVLDY